MGLDIPVKLFGLGTLLAALADDEKEVLSKDEGNSLSLVAKLLLLVVQEVTKVYMEQLGRER